MGITHTFHEFNQQKNNIWINLGIAGHKKEKIGNIFLIDKITDDETKKTMYPLYLIIAKLNKNHALHITWLILIILMIYLTWK